MEREENKAECLDAKPVFSVCGVVSNPQWLI
jgi:hypothetical protein